MKVKQTLRTLFVLFLLVSNVGCDQFTKGIARQKIEYHEQISLIKNYLTLTKIENTGAFLSVGNNLPEPFKTILLTISPLLILIAAFFYVLRVKHLSNLSIAGICFVIGGGIGNIYDRIQYGSVTDFLHIDLIVFQTGVFNMADVSIMTGMCMILLDLYRRAVSSDETMP
ncbi:MAG TPA: signal peptidase II [Chryseolinea sp.]